MPEKKAVHKPKSAGDEKIGGKKAKKNRWLLIAGLGVIALLVFFFVQRSNQNQQAAQQGQTPGTDPNAPGGTLAGQGTGGGIPGPEGPAGPAGPAGPRGPRGPGWRRKRHHKPPHHHHHHGPNPGGPMQGASRFATVRPGDTLNSIAARNNLNPSTLYHYNRSVVGSTPTIHPGMRLRV